MLEVKFVMEEVYLQVVVEEAVLEVNFTNHHTQ
jgi:hypothetical protein